MMYKVGDIIKTDEWGEPIAEIIDVDWDVNIGKWMYSIHYLYETSPYRSVLRCCEPDYEPDYNRISDTYIIGMVDVLKPRYTSLKTVSI